VRAADEMNRDEERAAVEAYKRWRADPALWVRQVLKVEPDAWQCDALAAIARDPRVGLSACAGPGKSALLAWVGLWWLDCHYDAQGICTSVTRENLRDGLWKEISSWYGKAAQLQAAFELQGQRLVHRERPETWWLAARGWAKDADANAQASALGGFHTKHPLFLMDEIGTLPDAVLVTADRIFTGGTEGARLVCAWNPETTTGAAYRISTRDRRRWTVINITGDPDDPKRSPRVSLEWARQQIEDWGRDNDWVRVNVLGMFPVRGADNLLGPDDITRAQGRDADPRFIANEASIWGLDPARSPHGDRSVLRERCGPVAFRPSVWRGLDGPSLAQRASHVLNESKRKPDYLFVDVGGVGASAFDHLVLLGWKSIVVPIDFAGSPEDDRFHDKNAEMNWRLAEWVRKTGCLPLDCGSLAGELTTRTFSYKARGKRTAYAVESKADLKDRGLPSPDEADALALTFASSHTPKRELALEQAQRSRQTRHERTWLEAR
jgi:phage terminase large subunit